MLERQGNGRQISKGRQEEYVGHAIKARWGRKTRQARLGRLLRLGKAC